MKFYDLKKNWRKIKPHLNNPEVQRILVSDFNKFTYGRWGKRFESGMLPEQFESCDWRLFKRGRPPEYYKYVKHAAAYWLVNFNLCLARLVEPYAEWRILDGDLWHTVWDGHDTLFDFTGMALIEDADECFRLANTNAVERTEYVIVALAEHYNFNPNNN